MDYEHNDYFPVGGYTNVYIAVPKGSQINHKYMVDDTVQPLLDAIIRERPHWKFAAQRITGIHPTETNTRWVNYFSVYEGDERLGVFTTTTKWRKEAAGMVYAYDTDRLRHERCRGAWTTTTKLPAAIKGVLKHFTAKQISELVNDRVLKMRQSLGGANMAAGREFQKQFAHIQTLLPNLVMNNWEVFAPLLRQYKVVLPDELPELHEKNIAAEKLFHACENRKGVMVYIRDNDYIVVRGHDGPRAGAMETNIVSSEILPAYYKRCLGLLKLLEVGDAIAGVGQRCLADTYFIIDEDEQ